MSWIAILVAVLFFLVGAGCLVLVLVGLPGGWIILALAGVIEYLDRFYLPEDQQPTIQWWVYVACVLLLLLGEALELIAGAKGAAKAGATRRGMVGALIGGLLGVFLFAGMFSVIPVAGTILGAFLGALLGTFLGALIAEMTGVEGTVRGSVKPALGATIGRVIGTVSKMGIAIAVWLVLSFCAFWP